MDFVSCYRLVNGGTRPRIALLDRITLQVMDVRGFYSCLSLYSRSLRHFVGNYDTRRNALPPAHIDPGSSWQKIFKRSRCLGRSKLSDVPVPKTNLAARLAVPHSLDLITSREGATGIQPLACTPISLRRLVSNSRFLRICA